MSLTDSGPPERGSRRGLVGNIGALSIVNIVSLVAPLAAVPVLTRTLGLVSYGQFALILGVVRFANVATDFGISMTGPIEIARARDDPRRSNTKVSEFFTINTVMFVLAACVLIGWSLFAEGGMQSAVGWAIVALFALTFQPFWYFQGREDLKWVSLYTSLAKLSYVIGILIFVRTGADAAKAVMIYAVSSLVATVICAVAMGRSGFRPTWVRLNSLPRLLRTNLESFLSRAAVAAYSSGSLIFLGMVASSHELALFSIAQQMYLAGQIVVMTLVQALYPYIARTKDFVILRKIVRVMNLIGVLAIVISVVLGQLVLTLVFGDGAGEAGALLVIYSVIFLISSTSALIGYPVFGSIDKIEIAHRTVLLAGALALIGYLVLGLLRVHGALPVLFLILLVEVSVLVARLIALYVCRAELHSNTARRGGH